LLPYGDKWRVHRKLTVLCFPLAHLILAYECWLTGSTQPRPLPTQRGQSSDA
jgi:hypothetical protein